jgi:6-pyruvoyltetrahydropterin/6-carboxytetrahydropterin synthase
MKHGLTVEGGTLRFAAAHFATFGGDCEPLHGHNYAVRVEVEGGLTPDGWVMDFGELRLIVSALCRELDHRFVLPLGNPHLRVDASEAAYEIRFGERLYIMPRGDVVPVAIDNSTAERLAEYLCQCLARELRQRGTANISAVTVAVEEMPGQAGRCTLPLKDEAG